ncbi:hypothetical protein LSCM1_05533 [Leishmania martiniquensis]|uniref:AAA+ ATPase domain-containing protein n=1 Tax=Leishmania martiniquensis TaxID=1580590 RepID=A0A836HCB3_9TRYP|nr:hypothetical protein LSCM1_05533 [Leishmania martiniquensis]
MDFEEAWREAVEEQQQQQQAREAAAAHDRLHVAPCTSHVPPEPSAVAGPIQWNTGTQPKPPAVKANDGDRGKSRDAYDEFSDEDLLRSVPCANDAAVEPTFGQLGPVALFSTAITTAATVAPNPRSPRPATASNLVAALPSSPPSSASPQGALDFPPIGVASFLLRGDNGRVRWVTTSGDGSASAGGRLGARAISRAIGHPASSEVVDAEATNVEDDAITVHADEGAATTMSRSAVAMQLSDAEDEEDVSDGAPSFAHRQASQRDGFLRDGVSVRAMLRDIYAEEATRQQQCAGQNEWQERQSAQSAAADESHSHLEALRDEALDGREGGRRQLVGFARPRCPAEAGTLARPRPRSALSSGDLWATKYSPKLFREMLSDETVNLRLLQWLKSWDAYVFSDDVSSAAKGAPTSAAGAAAAPSPPVERIAVLAGPPGVGKTTLVHVLAAHCGYEVIEVNASVERTASRLEALIKTAVSAAGRAPGGRVRRATASLTAAGAAVSALDYDSYDDERGESAAASVAEMTAAFSSSPHTSSSLAHHLLRPKCLLIDEMDGIASSSVAAYLLQQQLHRPVFCLCNDLYVPCLRPLRQRCAHVYHVPPIRPQRLLARLEEIARREGALMFDSIALSELVKTSGGDVRSCLNAMQLISSVVHQQQEQRLETGTDASSSHPAAPVMTAPSRHTVTELIRRMQGKDTRAALRDTWQLLFTRPERSKAVQLLKKEFGVDYEAFVEAAAAQHNRNVVPARRAVERERAIGAPAGREPAATQAALPRRVDSASARASMQPVAMGFRVDPGYLYAAQKLSCCPDSSGLVDGLQENYLNRAYTDYSFTHTSATADIFSRQDVATAAAFQHPEMMGTAERLCQVSALTCYVHCSTAARGGLIEFPREQSTLRRLQSELRHVAQQFREGCRPNVSAFLGGDEVISADVVPMLLRCLFDRSLRLPAHAISSFSRLPPADQRLLRASVSRHVDYGLDYQRDRQYTPLPAATAAFTAAGGSLSPFDSSSAVNVHDEAPWRLAPELDRLLAGKTRPVEDALTGGTGGGYRGLLSSRTPRFGGSGDGPHGSSSGPHPLPLSSAAKGSTASWASAADAGGGSSSGPVRTPSLASVMMPLRNEVRQILSGEISQYRIQQSMEHLKRQTEPLTTKKRAAAELTASGPERGAKRERVDSDASAAAASSGLAYQDDGTVTRDVRQVEPGATAGEMGAPVDKRPRADWTNAASVAATTTTPARRDFFGRPLPSADAGGAPTSSAGSPARSGARTIGGRRNVTSTAATLPSSGDASKACLPRPHSSHRPVAGAHVRYVYQDGSTNAVKMPATFTDF